MKFNFLLSLRILIIFVFVTGCQSSSIVDDTNRPSPTPTTIVTVTPATQKAPTTSLPEITSIEDFSLQFAWFYKPPEDGNPLSVLSQYFDVFILTHYDEEERDELKALGVKAPFLEYLLFVQIQDPGSCDEEPYGNQVAYKTGDFCQLLAEHPDWFLRDKNGDVIRNGKNVFMDPGNDNYRYFWLERARELQENFGWDGVFIDNVEASMNKFRRLESLPTKYASDDQYQAQIADFLSFVRSEYFVSNERPMYANIIEYSDKDVWMKYLQHLDGVMVEDFAVDYNERYYSPSDWENQLNMVAEAQALGKHVILVSQGSMNDADREKFSFASYLLVNHGNASFRYTDSDHYEEVWLYENFLVQLGNPTNEMYKDGQDWRRDFTNGFVLVNPRLKTSTIHLNE